MGLIKRALSAATFFYSGTAIALPPAAALPYKVEYGVKIPMRDGATLDATIIRPAGATAEPVILTLTPYVADRFIDVGAYFARHGYVFAIVDDRGRGNSSGVFEPWSEDGPDGADAVQWLAKRPWSDGQVGMWGGSYGGKNQWMIAGEHPPALKTIVPASPGFVGLNIGKYHGNVMRGFDQNWLVMVRGATANENAANDSAYWLGVYREASTGKRPFRDFDTLSGFPNPLWRKWMDHPAMDAYWDSASVAPANYRHMGIPTLSISGQFDPSNTGTMLFRQKQIDALPDLLKDSYLVIGPWDHPGSRVPKQVVGGLDNGPDAVIDVKALHVAWYDHVMKSGPVPAFLKDHFVYYLLGTNAWRSAPTVAAATMRRENLLLSSPSGNAGSVATHGRLGSTAGHESPDSYRYDPSLPAYNEGFEGGAMVSQAYLRDDAMVRRLNGDGLVYDTAPLARPANLIGIPALSLAMTIDVPDTDVRAVLYEVCADGTVNYLAQDWIRARYRQSPREAHLVTPGKAETYRFDNFPFIARTIAAGSVIRLAILPLGASLHVERNRNSGKPVEDETAADDRIAHVDIGVGKGGTVLSLPWGA